MGKISVILRFKKVLSPQVRKQYETRGAVRGGKHVLKLLPLHEIFSHRYFNSTTMSLGHTKEKRELNLEYSLDLATMVSPSKNTPIFILLN